MNKLREKRGNQTVEFLGVFIILIIIISIVISLFPVFIAKQELNDFAAVTLRSAEVTGEVGSEVNSTIITMQEKTKLNPEITWNVDYYKDKKIQLNSMIILELKTNVEIGYGIVKIPINVTSKAVGRSEVYWKN